jgi:hypothetical protein
MSLTHAPIKVIFTVACALEMPAVEGFTVGEEVTEGPDRGGRVAGGASRSLWETTQRLCERVIIGDVDAMWGRESYGQLVGLPHKIIWFCNFK